MSYFGILDEEPVAVRPPSPPPIPPKKRSYSYEEKIKILMICFGVSEDCAKYLYFRRKRGLPWHKTSDSKFLPWTYILQNKLILLDRSAGVDWNAIYFGHEDKEFIRHDISDSSATPQLAKIPLVSKLEDKDGYHKQLTKYAMLKELNKMGFIPEKYIS